MGLVKKILFSRIRVVANPGCVLRMGGQTPQKYRGKLKCSDQHKNEVYVIQICLKCHTFFWVVYMECIHIRLAENFEPSLTTTPRFSGLSILASHPIVERNRRVSTESSKPIPYIKPHHLTKHSYYSSILQKVAVWEK